VYSVIVTVPVVVGLRVGVRAAVLMYVFEVAVILALTFAILVHGGARGLGGSPLSFNFPSAKDLGLAFALGILAFVGFEAPAPLGEESRNPRRTVPLAIVTGVLVTGGLYVLSSFAVVEAFPSAHSLATDPAPFVTASDRFLSPVAGIVTWLFLTSASTPRRRGLSSAVRGRACGTAGWRRFTRGSGRHGYRSLSVSRPAS
jgi:amino acid transporter